MPCPSSGLILLGKIRQELESSGTGNDYDNGPYTSNETTLKNASDGTYDAINEENHELNRPNELPAHHMTEFYSYNHNATGGEGWGGEL